MLLKNENQTIMAHNTKLFFSPQFVNEKIWCAQMMLVATATLWFNLVTLDLHGGWGIIS